MLQYTLKPGETASQVLHPQALAECQYLNQLSLRLTEQYWVLNTVWLLPDWFNSCYKISKIQNENVNQKKKGVLCHTQKAEWYKIDGNPSKNLVIANVSVQRRNSSSNLYMPCNSTDIWKLIFKTCCEIIRMFLILNHSWNIWAQLLY